MDKHWNEKWVGLFINDVQELGEGKKRCIISSRKIKFYNERVKIPNFDGSHNLRPHKQHKTAHVRIEDNMIRLTN